MKSTSTSETLEKLRHMLAVYGLQKEEGGTERMS